MTEKIKANIIDHISIACHDVLEAEKDYMEIFGWEVRERYFDPDSHINLTAFSVGPTTVEVMEDEYSGGWYELQDLNGNKVFSGKGDETKWVKKKEPRPEGKMADLGYWMTKYNNNREGVQLISLNVDNIYETVEKLKSNGATIIPEKFHEKKREIRFWAEKKRNYALIHPKKMHGVLWEIIHGKSDM